MPIMHAALKSIRSDKKKTLRNLDTKTRLKTQLKKIETLIKANKLEEAKKEFVKTASLLDKTASRGIIPKNRASRKKSRLAKSLNRSKQA